MGGLSGSEIRPGTVDTKAISAELFPFEDFSMSPLDSTDPTLELRTPRRLIAEVTARTKTPTGSSITIGATDGYTHYYITTGASDFTVNLPALAAARGPLYFWKMDSGAGEIVVDPNGSETITAAAAYTTLRVGLQGQFLALLPSSTTWMKIGGVTQPVALEPDIGRGFHRLNRTVTTYDLSGRTEAYTSPYTWDVSSLIPVGAKEVELHVEGLGSATAELLASAIFIWDYDRGAYSLDNVDNRGARLPTPYKPATAAARDNQSGGNFKCSIGTSRKLYAGRYSSNTSIYAILVGYYLG